MAKDGKRIPYWQEEPMTLPEWREAIERNVRSLNVDLNDLVTSVNRLSRYLVAPPTTAERETTALTKDGPSDALKKAFDEWPGDKGTLEMPSTIPTTLQSSPSDRVDTPSGPAEPHFVCVHIHEMLFRSVRNGLHPLLAWEWCPTSGEPVLKASGRTPAQVAAHTSSTYQKQPSNSSVDPSGEVFATSPSSLGTDRCDWCNQTRDWHAETWRGHVFQKTAGVK